MSEFKREERYIVIKRKELSSNTEKQLRGAMTLLNVPTIECLVIESDWPEYEPVWAMIEARMTGRTAPAEPAICPTCGEDEPFSGACGTSTDDTKALCRRTAPDALQAEVERLKAEVTDLIEARDARVAERLAVLDGLRDENQRLREEVERLKENSKRCAELDDVTIRQLGDRLRTAEADAERYRWLRDGAQSSNFNGDYSEIPIGSIDCVMHWTGSHMSGLYGEELDAEIDAARTAKPEVKP